MSRGQPPAWAVRTEADRAALKAGYYWDQDQADRVVRFAHEHVLPKQVDAGQFRLFPWQVRYLQNLYGWRDPDGNRRWKIAVLHIAKKNGKTLLVAILAQYELFAAGVRSPIVVSASTDRDNAGQVFKEMHASIKRNPRLLALSKITPSKMRVECPKRDGEYWAMSSDKGGAEGWNISFGIVDEAHAHRAAGLFKALEYGTVGRPDGVLCVISTAGDDLTHWYYSLLQRGRAILSGANAGDLTTYAEIYECPADADFDDPATWKLGNPSLDLYPGFTSRMLGLLWEAAKADTASRLNFLRYRLNVFCSGDDTPWIELADWDLAARDIPDDVLARHPCWLGFDGSLTTDPTSLACCWLLPGPSFHLKSFAWVAEEGVRYREKGNLPRYQEFMADGLMEMTDGGMIDKDAVRARIDDVHRTHKVRGVIADSHGAHVFGSELANDGYEVRFMRQGFQDFSEPTEKMAANVRAGTLTHDAGSWLRWCVHSVRLKVGPDNQQRPIRSKSRDKIDGAVAGIMSFRGALDATADPDQAAGGSVGFYAV